MQTIRSGELLSLFMAAALPERGEAVSDSYAPRKTAPGARLMLLASVLLFATAAAHAQAWTNRYDGIAHGNDYVAAIATDKSGNVFVAGTSEGADSFKPDFVLIKYSNAGMPLWVNRYTAYNKELTSPGKISVDPDGNVLVLSSSGEGNATFSTGRMLMKVSGSGAKMWTNSARGEVVVGPNGQLAATTETNVVMYSAGGSPLHTNVFYNYGGVFPNDVAAYPIMSMELKATC